MPINILDILFIIINMLIMREPVDRNVTITKLFNLLYVYLDG